MDLQKALLEHVEAVWDQPDEGIWESRGGAQQFVHSKVLAWVAVDRAIKAVEGFGLDGPVERWKALRDRIHAEICRRGFDRQKGAFVQAFGSSASRRKCAAHSDCRLPSGNGSARDSDDCRH